MKQTFYRKEIIERFLTPKEQETFDFKYHEAKIVVVGRKEVDKRLK